MGTIVDILQTLMIIWLFVNLVELKEMKIKNDK